MKIFIFQQYVKYLKVFKNIKYYPCYNNDDNIFVAHNKIINKHNSLEDNGIKNNDIIIVKEKITKNDFSIKNSLFNNS